MGFNQGPDAFEVEDMGARCDEEGLAGWFTAKGPAAMEWR